MHAGKKFDVWNDQEAKPFPEVGDEYFKITDKSTIKELSNIMHTHEKSTPDIIKGSEKFTEKAHNVFGELDKLKKENPNTVSNQWMYYSLEDVEIDDNKTLTNAHDFLEELRKKNVPKAPDTGDKMDAEFKPIYHVPAEKMKVEKEKKVKTKFERSKLSFGDEL